MSADVYRFDDYRAFIKARAKEEKPAWGVWARLARAANCQPTYLTQALKGRVHLTTDHLHHLALHWELSEPETDFLFLLLDYAKAGSRGLRERQLGKIKALRQEREDLSKRFAVGAIESGEKEGIYFSAWHMAALHIIVTIPEFRTPSAIARRLHLPLEFVEHALKWLIENDFVKKEAGELRLSTADLHIGKTSPFLALHHSNWRQRAIFDAMIPGKQSSVHFTGVYTLSRADYEHLKEKMLDLIAHSRKVIAPSKEEEIACFLCDLFFV